MKIFSSLKKHATNFLEPYKQGEPATYAAAEQAIGAVLITDGFLGIDNPLGGKKRPGVFGALGGVIIGIIFMLIPVFAGGLVGSKKLTASTTATVVSINKQQTPTTTTSTNGSTTTSTSTSCTITASYMVNGQQYSEAANSGSSSDCGVAAGQSIDIRYDPNNPTDWSSASDLRNLGLVLKIFFVVGLLAAISSIVTFVIRLLSIIFGWKLIRDGRKNAAQLPSGTNLQTMIEEIKGNFSKSVFGFGAGGMTPAMPIPSQPATPNVTTTPTAAAVPATAPASEPTTTAPSTPQPGSTITPATPGPQTPSAGATPPNQTQPPSSTPPVE